MRLRNEVVCVVLWVILVLALLAPVVAASV